MSLGLIAAASSVTRTKVIADAAAMGAALDIATRPRIVPIGLAGSPVTPAPTKTPSKIPWKIPFVLGLNLPTAVIGAIVSSGGGGTKRGDRSSDYPLVFEQLRAPHRAAPRRPSSRSKVDRPVQPRERARLSARRGRGQAPQAACEPACAA